MKRKFLIGAGLVFAGAAAFAVAQDPGMEEMMARWMAFATPGEDHKVLAHKVGKWEFKVTMFQPGAPPSESTGTSVAEWIMDGRYVQDTITGEFQGMPFHGLGITGYDNMKKKYTGMWIDNMGTGIMVSEGDWDAATKTFTFRSEGPDVMTGKYVPTRTTDRMIADGQWVTEMFNVGADGKETRTMLLEYTRTK